VHGVYCATALKKTVKRLFVALQQLSVLNRYGRREPVLMLLILLLPLLPFPTLHLDHTHTQNTKHTTPHNHYPHKSLARPFLASQNPKFSSFRDLLRPQEGRRSTTSPPEAGSEGRRSISGSGAGATAEALLAVDRETTLRTS